MKRDARSEIIRAGADLIHRQGFNRTGLKEILDAAGVPKGSFYFYFKSKEDFGLALIEHFMTNLAEVARPIREDASLSALERLKRFYAMLRARFEECGCERGCPVGNLAQEMSDLSPALRQALSRAFGWMVRDLEIMLTEAKREGDLPGDLDATKTAAFMIDAWEGALISMKAEKSLAPLERFDEMVFGRLLR